MRFPLLCLGISFSLFGIISWCSSFMLKKVAVSLLSPATRGRFQHLPRLIFSDSLHGWFLISLVFSMTLILLGAALLFSLPLRSTWSVLALGCLSVLGGLLLIGGYRH